MNEDAILEEARQWLSIEQEGFELHSKQEFTTWINTSNLHKKTYEEEKSFRESIKALPKYYKQKTALRVKSQIKRNNILAKAAKILLPLAACFLLVFSFYLFSEEEIYKNTIYSQNKIIQNILLPDNSKITLDAKSKIEIIYSHNKREVLLKEGRAVFEVSSNKNKSFYVRSNNILVQVVGTKFEVSKEKDKTIISVLEGIVNIRLGSNDKSRILAQLLKGDILDISNNGTINKLDKDSLNLVASWRNEKLIFLQTPLSQVIKKFSKYLNINVELDLDNQDTYPITGEFNVYEFNKFLDYLPLIYPIKIDKNKTNLIILKNNS